MGDGVQQAKRSSQDIRNTAVAQEVPTKVRGPVLSFEKEKNIFVLNERSGERIVEPRWFNGELRIGCTTITKDAFEKLREFRE